MFPCLDQSKCLKGAKSTHGSDDASDSVGRSEVTYVRRQITMLPVHQAVAVRLHWIENFSTSSNSIHCQQHALIRYYQCLFLNSCGNCSGAVIHFAAVWLLVHQCRGSW
ncbi:hypothetical protein K474DRAFT_970810 [Panus rudis PR-1116 ss-1]|nr:hypothetical protein K474DRAFT_970810 [Panus rudis PR-1116 ss-1]